MGLFDAYIKEVRDYLDERRQRQDASIFDSNPPSSWPAGQKNNLVLSADTAVELGSPRTASTSFLLWTEDPAVVHHGRTTLIGPDVFQESRSQVPFGKAVLAGVTGFDEENSYDRFREMELAKYDLRLAGYMMRAVSQYQREWSRVSRKAVEEKFSLSFLGQALTQELITLPYVTAVEIIFVTASIEDVLALKSIGDGVAAIIGAMNKMVEEMDFDCSSCEYREICDSAAELRAMRNAIQKKQTT